MMAKAKKSKESQNALTSFKSRKFLVSVACLTIGTVVDIVTDRGLSDNLLTFLIAMSGAYTAGNILSKGARSLKKPDKESSKETSDDVEKKLLDVSKDLKQYDDYLKQHDDYFKQHDEYLSSIVTTVEQLQQQVGQVNKRVNALIQGSQ